MSDITRLPYNTTILDRLFSQMPSGFSSDPVEEDAIVFSATYENRLKSGTIKKIIQYLPNTEKAYQAEVEMPSVATVFGSITGNTFAVRNEDSANLSVDQYVKPLTYDPLTRVGQAINDANPVLNSIYPDIMAIDPLGRFLYVRTVTSNPSSLIKTYLINRITGTLDLVDTIVLDTDYLVYITTMSVDITGKFLFFTGSTMAGPTGDYISTYSINQANGRLTFAFRTSLGQTLPKKLIVEPSGKFVYVLRSPSTNTDVIIKGFSINQSTGQLTLCETLPITSLSFAYDLITTVDGKFLYVCGTSAAGIHGSGNIKKFTINTSTGALTNIEDTTLPESEFTTIFRPTLMARSPDGKFLYVTTAEENGAYYRLITYSINQSTGILTQQTYIQITDVYYRNILLDKNGDYLICSYTNPTGYLRTYKIDKPTGGLTLHATEPISVLGGEPVEIKDIITITTSVADTSGSLIFSSCWRNFSGDAAKNRVLIHQINTEFSPFKILSINTATVAGFSSYTINATISASSQYFSVYDNFLIGGTISGYLNTYKTNIIGTLSQVSGPSLFITFADLLPFGISKQNENSMYASLTSIGISGLQYELQLDISKISLHIADAELTISSDNEYIVSESIDLENYTIQSLMNFFEDRYTNKDSKIILTLADNASSDILDLSATVLCEGSASLKNGSVTWTRFTNQNYSLITAFALIVKIYKKLIAGALAQTDQRLATRDWLEYWGSLLGISRESYEQFDEKTSEPDTAYRERMRRETMFPKSNNVAMAYLLSQATSRNVTVSDGGQPFVLASPLSTVVNTLPVCVNNGSPAGTISISGLTVTGSASDLFTDFTSANSVNSLVSPAYILVEKNRLEGGSLKLQVSSFQSATSLTVLEYDRRTASGSITLSADDLSFVVNKEITMYSIVYTTSLTSGSGTSWAGTLTVSGGFETMTLTASDVITAIHVATVGGAISLVTLIVAASVTAATVVTFTSTTSVAAGTLTSISIARSGSSVGIRSVGSSSIQFLNATTMTVSTHTSGKWSLGQIVTGGTIDTGNVVKIVGFLSGTGGVGTYAVEQSNPQIISSLTVVTAAMSISNSLYKTAGRSHTPVPALTASSSVEYFLGPSTGGGAFSVKIPLLPAESDVSQTLVSFVSRLINKYKPAGIPFTIN